MMKFRVLGSLEVVDQDGPLALGAPKQRALLAVLLLHRGERVSTERLIDEIWGERPPVSANKIVQGYVSSLRRVLGDGRPARAGRARGGQGRVFGLVRGRVVVSLTIAHLVGPRKSPLGRGRAKKGASGAAILAGRAAQGDVATRVVGTWYP